MTVTRADLEAKLRQIEGAVDETKESARNAGVLIAVAVVALIALFYLMGRRKGKKGSARVEVYRLG
jgi:hypothetical protein